MVLMKLFHALIESTYLREFEVKDLIKCRIKLGKFVYLTIKMQQ